MNKKIIGLSTVATLALTGCNAVDKADRGFEITKDKIDNAHETQQLNNGALYKIDKQGIYVDKTPIDTLSLDSQQKLPKSFYKKVEVNDQQPKNKEDLASFLTKVTGIKVIIQQDLLDDTAGSSGALVGGNVVANPPATGNETSVENTGVSSVAGAIVNEVMYTGTVKGLLDHVTSKLNVYWKWDKDQVEIYKYETKMFSLDALSGENVLKASLTTDSKSSSGSSSSSTNEANSGQKTEINNTVDVWKEVGAAIQTVLSENEKVSLTPSAGKVVVMATPAHMRKVENILKEYNRFYSRLVRLDIKVYQVETKDEDSYGINWSGVWQNSKKTAGLAVNMGGALTNNVVTVSGSGGSMQTGKAIFDALSTVGKTSVLRNNSVVTLNNQSVPLNVAREIAYVQSTSVSTTDSTSSTEINPGVVTEGFAMNLTPLVNDKGEVLLQYSVDSSTVEDIETFSSSDGSSTVQLPRRSVNNFLQKVSIRNGESMVLTGFQEVKGSHVDSGVGSAKTWFLGGSRSGENNLKTIVVVITPYVLK